MVENGEDQLDRTNEEVLKKVKEKKIVDRFK